MSMIRPLLLTLTLVAASMAGCLELHEDTSSSKGSGAVRKTASPAAPVAGTMTGQIREETKVAACSGVAVPPTYCATRTVWAWGDLDLSSLPVAVSTFGGPMDILAASEGTWNVTAVLAARGSSEAEARSRLANIEYEFSHEDGDRHSVTAKARKKQSNTNGQESASVRAAFPAKLALDLSAASAGGAVSASGLRFTQVQLTSAGGAVSLRDATAQWARLESAGGALQATGLETEELYAQTAGGRISVDVKARSVTLTSSGGSVDAKVTPTGHGHLRLTSSGGSVELTVPEDRAHGYTIQATSSGGRAEIDLEDGSVSGNDYSKRFTTNGYSSRSIRSEVDLTSSGGSVRVDAA